MTGRLLLIAALGICAACGDGERTDTVPAAPGGVSLGVPRIAPDTYRVAAAAGTTLQVVVRLRGEPPADTTVQARAFSPACGASFVDSSVVLGENRRVTGALVWLEGIPGGPADTSARRVTLTIDACRLLPRMSILPRGGTLQVMTRDSVVDSIVIASVSGTRDTLPFSQAGQLVPVTDRARTAGVLSVFSTRLPWMRAVVAVAPTPFWRVTDSTGVVTFTDVPVGTAVTVRAWHPALRAARQRISVTASSPAVTLDLTR
jgi:hypothetical protein